MQVPSEQRLLTLKVRKVKHVAGAIHIYPPLSSHVELSFDPPLFLTNYCRLSTNKLRIHRLFQRGMSMDARKFNDLDIAVYTKTEEKSLNAIIAYSCTDWWITKETIAY